MIRFSEDYMHMKWASGERIRVRGVMRRVGKMSYGAYFLESGPELPETFPHKEDTLWPERVVLDGGRAEYRI